MRLVLTEAALRDLDDLLAYSPPTIPPGAKIIVFHGKPNPPDVIAGVSGKWYRRVLPAQWVADHWR